MKKLFETNGILVNDNHVGTIGELYAKVFLESKGLKVKSASRLNDPYDLEDNQYIRYSVKTITSENTRGKTSPINVDENWSVLIAIKLNKEFQLEKIALIEKRDLINNSVFKNNIFNRKNGKKSHPKFQWWNFLDDYLKKN